MKIFKKGFTFIEIIIAISIFGIVAIVCLTNYLISLRNIKIINDKIELIFLSEKIIEDLKLQDEEIKEKQGTFDFPYSDYTWKIELSDIIVSETSEKIELVPYKLKIESPSESYSIILPFLKLKENE